MKEQIGDRIKKLRRKNNWTQKDLANILDVSPSTIGMYEQNRREPDNDLLLKISQVLNVSLDRLLGNTKYSEPPAPRSELYDLIDQMDESEIAELENYVDFILSKKNK